jgi:hypothetical protein
MHAPAKSTARSASKSSGRIVVASALRPEFRRLFGNLSRHSLDAATDIRKRLWDRRLACRWGVVSQTNWTGETPVPLRSGTFAADSTGIAETSCRPKNNLRSGCGNLSDGSENVSVGADSYTEARNNYPKACRSYTGLPANCFIGRNNPTNRLANYPEGLANCSERLANYSEGLANCSGHPYNSTDGLANYPEDLANCSEVPANCFRLPANPTKHSNKPSTH